MTGTARTWWRWALPAALLLAGPPANAQDGRTCPPVAQPPTPGQLHEAARSARDRGFLWRISKQGHTSYLYGTIHVGKLAWTLPGPKVGLALQATDTLALEIDLTDPALAGSGAVPAAGVPPLPPGVQTRLAHQVAAACLPASLSAGQHPVMLAATLTLLAARWEGLDPLFAQEIALAGHARAHRRSIVSLETVQFQHDALIPRESARVQPMVEDMLTQLESGNTRRVLARLALAWERGDLAELENHAQWCDCVNTAEDRAYIKRLNDDRNPALADRIDALHREGRRVFAAVGALHMTGALGLPRLLAQRGYRVERVDFARERRAQ